MRIRIHEEVCTLALRTECAHEEPPDEAAPPAAAAPGAAAALVEEDEPPDDEEPPLEEELPSSFLEGAPSAAFAEWSTST